ncbi:AmpC, Beta-lactamase class C penicillin binding protein [Pyrenophora tritici-repentis]|nr:AmpC, Beta-lactamase class C penicillin binding protein [Pyrenophora tritici-repentis]
MPLSPEACDSIIQTLDKAVKNGAPGLVFHAIDKSGATLVSHAAGNLGVDTPISMNTTETLFWMASCTKLVTAIAILQLVEQGEIPLHDEEWLAKIAPEIKAKKVYRAGSWGDGEEQEKGITMSMLLSHTAGFGYGFSDINMDWAGIILERVTKQTLSTYFTAHIFTPLSIPPTSATFFPPSTLHPHLAKLHTRDPITHVLSERPHLFQAALSCPPQTQPSFYQSGGAGLFCRPTAFTTLLAVLLNSGACPSTNTRILAPSSVDLLFTNQIPTQPNFARGNPPPADASLVNEADDMYPQKGDPAQGWGYGGFLTLEEGETGRSGGTMWWMGLANCFWWVDRERSVAGCLGAQVLPGGDEHVVRAWGEVEKGVYGGLVG